MNHLISSQEAADILGLKKRALLNLVASGHLKAMRIGNAFVYDPRDVARARIRPAIGRPPSKKQNKVKI